MHRVYVSLGGNIGDRAKNFEQARTLVQQRLGKIIQASSTYESPAWGYFSEHAYWNQVLLIETVLEAEELLWRIKEIEDLMGREFNQGERYTDRPIDLDILYFDDVFLESASLIIPHAKLHERKFVLVPLAEIAPEMKHPLLRLTNLEMLDHCLDESMVKKIATP